MQNRGLIGIISSSGGLLGIGCGGILGDLDNEISDSKKVRYNYIIKLLYKNQMLITINKIKTSLIIYVYFNVIIVLKSS